MKSCILLVGCPIGVNLEPVDLSAELQEERLELEIGRQANLQTFKRAEDLGIDFICLTGNPGTGVSNKQIIKAIEEAKRTFSGLIIAGKMHGAGVDEAIVDVGITQNY